LSTKLIPQILLIDSGGGEHKGLQGSYCWNGICVDFAHPSKRTDFPEKIAIKNGSVMNFKIMDDVTTPPELRMTFFSGNNIVLDQPASPDQRINLAPGNYFLNVAAYWKGQGDVSNVFLIQVG
jgi:hypothetical protein